MQQRPPKSVKRNWTPWIILGGSMTVGIAVFMAFVGMLLVLYLSSNQIPTGVSVAGITVGGQSSSAAQASLQTLNNRPIRLTDGDRSWQMSLADLGVALDVDATLQAATKASSGSALQPRYTINLSQAQTGLASISTQVNIPASAGNPPQQGRAMDIPVTLDRLRVDVSGELADGILNLDMVAVDPPAPDPDAPYSGETSTYIVQPGQELGLIAKEYGVDIADIVSLNDITNPDLLYVVWRCL
jgi:LysM repeat protein